MIFFIVARNISVVITVQKREHLAEYELALLTVRCYCELYGYPLHIIFSDEYQHGMFCPQADVTYI